MLSGGVRVVTRLILPCSEASVSVAMSGGRWPTLGIGLFSATGISPVDPISLEPILVRASTSKTPDLGSGSSVQ